jgi:hypothetical protein
MADPPQVRQLFADKQPGPAEGDIGSTFIDVARTISQICATRMLLMIAVLAGSGIWLYTIADPSRDRLYAAVAFSIVFLGPLTALYARKG